MRRKSRILNWVARLLMASSAAAAALLLVAWLTSYRTGTLDVGTPVNRYRSGVEVEAAWGRWHTYLAAARGTAYWGLYKRAADVREDAALRLHWWDAGAVADHDSTLAVYGRGVLGFHRLGDPDGLFRDSVPFAFVLVRFPLWAPLAAVLVPWAVALARRRRRRSREHRGLCPECGYDLRATPAKCPECGVGREVLASSAA